MQRKKATQLEIDQWKKLMSKGCEVDVVTEAETVKEVSFSHNNKLVFKLVFETYSHGLYRILPDPEPERWLVEGLIEDETVISKEFTSETKALTFKDKLENSGRYDKTTTTHKGGDDKVMDLVPF